MARLPGGPSSSFSGWSPQMMIIVPAAVLLPYSSTVRSRLTADPLRISCLPSLTSRKEGNIHDQPPQFSDGDQRLRRDLRRVLVIAGSRRPTGRGRVIRRWDLVDLRGERSDDLDPAAVPGPA